MPISPDLRSLNDLAMKLMKYGLPNYGTSLEVNIGVHGRRHVVPVTRLTSRADAEKEITLQTLLWALPVLLRSVPLDQIVLIIGCALAEMKVCLQFHPNLTQFHPNLTRFYPNLTKFHPNLTRFHPNLTQFYPNLS